MSDQAMRNSSHCSICGKADNLHGTDGTLDDPVLGKHKFTPYVPIMSLSEIMDAEQPTPEPQAGSEPRCVRTDCGLPVDHPIHSYSEKAGPVGHIFEAEAAPAEPPNVFQSGIVRLHSGATSTFKIECESLTDADIACLALMVRDILPAFGDVEGVPRGGLRIAKELRKYKTTGPLLIVDDVMTSGSSMEAMRNGREAIGAVIFQRQQGLEWVTPLFKMTMAAPAELPARCPKCKGAIWLGRCLACNYEPEPPRGGGCAARKQGTAGGNDPADCDWPFCGCDPAADKVIAAIQESGYEITRPSSPSPALGVLQPWIHHKSDCTKLVEGCPCCIANPDSNHYCNLCGDTGNIPPDKRKCNCGLDAALASLSQKEGQ